MADSRKQIKTNGERENKKSSAGSVTLLHMEWNVARAQKKNGVDRVVFRAKKLSEWDDE